MNEAEVACGCFVISGGQASGAFELVEAPFDLVAQGIDGAIDRDLLLAVRTCRNDRRTAASCHRFPDSIGIVALVSDDHLCLWRVLIQQGIEPFVVGHFATADLGPQGQALGVGDQMNLGREATL